MKILIVYKSKTGFTEKYAYLIKNKLNCDIVKFKELKDNLLNQYDVIIYGSRIHAGRIDGLEKIKKICNKKLVVFATGGTPSKATDVINDIWKNNFNEELEYIPHFYMQGGMCYEKMDFFDKLIMKLVSKMMDKKKNKTDNELGFSEKLNKSYDISNESFIEPLILYLNELK